MRTPLVAKAKPIRMAKPQVKVMLDSGAFSAWRLGKPVDLEAYCDFIKENEEWLHQYVCLDVINPDSPEDAARESYKNLRYMHKRGLRPIPVFHAKEGFDWLKRILDSGADYIGFAGLSLGSKTKIFSWYQSAWSHIVDSTGKPLVKVHGFGEGDWKNITSFPWKSTDSTSWLMSARMSGTMRVSRDIIISHKQNGKHSSGVPDFDQLDAESKAAVLSLLRAHGVGPAAFALRGGDSRLMRMYVTLLYYHSVRQDARSKLAAHQAIRGFFSDESEGAAVDVTPFEFYMVAEHNMADLSCLAKAKYDSMLTSYYTISRKHSGIRSFAYHPEEYVAQTTFWETLNRYVKEI